MLDTFDRFHARARALIADGDIDAAYALLRGALGDRRMRDDALLWLGLAGLAKPDKTAHAASQSSTGTSSANKSSTNKPGKWSKLAQAALGVQLLRHSSRQALQLMGQSFLNYPDARQAQAAAAFAAEAYRTDPTDLTTLRHMLAAIPNDGLANPRARQRELMVRHAPHLREPEAIASLIELLIQNLGQPCGAIWQQGERLHGWCLIEAGAAMPTLTLHAGQRRIAFQPRRRIPLSAAGAASVDSVWFELALQGQANALAVTLPGTDGRDRPLVGGPLEMHSMAIPHQREASQGKGASAGRASGVTVLIPVYKGLEMTRRCIESALANRGINRTPHRLVVINDASPEPALVALLDDYAAKGLIELHHQRINRGFIGTVNHGLGLHPERDVVLLNADTRVHGDWLDRLHRAAYRRERVASVTPLSNNGELMSLLAPCEAGPAPDDNGLAALNEAAARANAEADSADVPLATGCGFCLYMRRDALDEIGGLDPSLTRGYGEESDWCYRASAHGWQHRGAVDLVVAHEGGVSFGAEKRLRVQQNLAVLEKRYPHAEREFTACLKRDPTAAARHRLMRDWLRRQALTHMREPGSGAGILFLPSLAHAKRHCEAGNSGQGQVVLAKGSHRHSLCLMGSAPQRWRIDYRLPDQRRELEDDLHALGFVAIVPAARIPVWVEAALPGWAGYTGMQHGISNTRALFQPQLRTPSTIGQGADSHSQSVPLADWQARYSEGSLLAVAGQPEALEAVEFSDLLTALARHDAGHRLLPLRTPRDWTPAQWSSGHLFPMPVLESTWQERAELCRMHFPFDALLLLDSDPLTLAEARWLDRADQPLTWLMTQAVADACSPEDIDTASPGAKRQIVLLSELAALSVDKSCETSAKQTHEATHEPAF